MEIDHYQQRLALHVTKESEMLLTVKTDALRVGDIVHLAFLNGFVIAGDGQQGLVESPQVFLLRRQLRAVELTFVRPSLDTLYTPVVEDGCATVDTAEALHIHAAFAYFLTGIDHERTLVERRGHDHRGFGTPAVAAEESAGQTLLVMVLEEIEHMVDTRVAVLHPLTGDTIRRPALTGHAAQVLVHTHFVVQIVEACSQVRIVLIRVVALADEDEFLVFLLHLRDGPCKELHRYHLGHVHTHAVDAFACPEKQDIQHLRP